jgi:hypothetical protein
VPILLLLALGLRRRFGRPVGSVDR